MSDLDEEEVQATREMKQINKIISPEEKSADELFEKLGYIRKQTILSENYCNENKKIIQFWKDKTIASIIKRDSDCIDYEFITMQELQAINKKCKELRMVGIIYIICMIIMNINFILYFTTKKEIFGIIGTLFLCIVFVLKGVVR